MVFDPRVGIVLLAATNRPEIDAAFLRAGRFDRQVVMDRPDRKGTDAILKVHVKKFVAAPDLEVEREGLTPGFTGADLANEAAIFATRRGDDSVKMEDFTNANERTVAGSERKSQRHKPEDRERVAYHKMRHALAATSIARTGPVQKASIFPRSIWSLGYTLQRPTENRFLMTSGEPREGIVALLTRCAAEDVICGEISTRAAADLAKATDIAQKCATRFGMDAKLGQAVLEEQKARWLGAAETNRPPKDYSEVTAHEVDLAVRHTLDEAYAAAKALLTGHHAELKVGAALLLERETITPAGLPSLRRKCAAEVLAKRNPAPARARP